MSYSCEYVYPLVLLSLMAFDLFLELTWECVGAISVGISVWSTNRRVATESREGQVVSFVGARNAVFVSCGRLWMFLLHFLS